MLGKKNIRDLSISPFQDKIKKKKNKQSNATINISFLFSFSNLIHKYIISIYIYSKKILFPLQEYHSIPVQFF